MVGEGARLARRATAGSSTGTTACGATRTRRVPAARPRCSPRSTARRPSSPPVPKGTQLARGPGRSQRDPALRYPERARGASLPSRHAGARLRAARAGRVSQRLLDRELHGRAGGGRGRRPGGVPPEAPRRRAREGRDRHGRAEVRLEGRREGARAGAATASPSRATRMRAAYFAIAAEVAVDAARKQHPPGARGGGHRQRPGGESRRAAQPDRGRHRAVGELDALREGRASTTRASARRDWSTYPILRFDGVPETIEVHIIDRPGQPYLGSGEAAQGPTAAAIGNAVANATGVRKRDLPFRA